MDVLIETYGKGKNLHHAYIIEGEREAVRAQLFDFIEHNLEYATQGNPDFFHGSYESFSIDDARKLRDMQNTKAISGDRRICVIELLTMTVEAQNSLLKVFEEPNPGTHFFIITSTAEIFLPTLLSRMVVIKNDSGQLIAGNDAKAFVKKTIPERLSFVAEIIEEKDKARAITLVNDVIKTLHDNDKIDAVVLEELLRVREYLSDRSPSLKLLLEHVALIVP